MNKYRIHFISDETFDIFEEEYRLLLERMQTPTASYQSFIMNMPDGTLRKFTLNLTHVTFIEELRDGGDAVVLPAISPDQDRIDKERDVQSQVSSLDNVLKKQKDTD